MYLKLKPLSIYILSCDPGIHLPAIERKLHEWTEGVIEFRIRVLKTLPEIQKFLTRTFDDQDINIVIFDRMSPIVIPNIHSLEDSFSHLAELVVALTSIKPRYLASVTALSNEKIKEGSMISLGKYGGAPFFCDVHINNYPNLDEKKSYRTLARYNWPKLVTKVVEYMDFHRGQIHITELLKKISGNT